MPLNPIEYARQLVQGAIKQVPSLTPFGIGISDYRAKIKADGIDAVKSQIALDQKDLFSDEFLKQVNTCRIWLAGCNSIARINSLHSSYAYKHMVERWTVTHQDDSVETYISNGAFIVAALGEGYRIKYSEDSPNATFNIGTRSPAIQADYKRTGIL